MKEKLMEILKKVAEQITSGRWLLTLACSIVFVYCAMKAILSPADIKEIIRDVIVFYFVVKNMGASGTPKQS